MATASDTAGVAAETRRIERWLHASVDAHQTVGVETVLATGKYQRLTLSADPRNDRRSGYDHHHGNLDAAELGATYLGGNRWTTLAAAGRVQELKAGALQRAEAMFASAPSPWCPTHF